MKKIFTLFVIGMLFVNSTEAKSINKLNFINIYSSVDSIPPLFPGGSDAWVEYLNSKLNYNVPVNNNAPLGQYRIDYKFTIDKEGKITDLIFENNPGYGIRQEVTRVLKYKNLPKWTPALVNGEPIVYQIKHFLIFIVSED
jgi:protein TonB